MFDNPFGGGLNNGDPNSLMRMLSMLFNRGGQQQQQIQQPQQQNQSQMPPWMSGVSQVLDPNKGFMGGLMSKLKPGFNPGVGQRTGAPISNTPSINMGNDPFIQMPWSLNKNQGQGQL